MYSSIMCILSRWNLHKPSRGKYFLVSPYMGSGSREKRDWAKRKLECGGSEAPVLVYPTKVLISLHIILNVTKTAPILSYGVRKYQAYWPEIIMLQKQPLHFVVRFSYIFVIMNNDD